MGNLMAAIGDATLSDLTLPGTHDTMTYDLSTVVSDGGIDDHPEIAKVLHELSKLHLTPGDFIRRQATTQTLNITAQLDSGIRFLDFRIMLTGGDWYCLHMLQSNRKAVDYLHEIKDWLDQHPSEVISIWLSKHGSECKNGTDQYPGVSVADKRKFWDTFVSLFDGLLIDTNTSHPDTTPLSTLVSRHHRVVPYVSDHTEMTGGDSRSMDGCAIDNQLGAGVDDEPHAMKWEMTSFTNAPATRKSDAAADRLYLMSMAASAPGPQIEAAFEIDYIPFSKKSATASCTKAFGIPNMTWCPDTLLDIGRLTNYYSQVSLTNVADDSSLDLPHAFYLDAVTADGGFAISYDGDKSFAYVDTILYINLRRVCTKTPSDACKSLLSKVDARRKLKPLDRFVDAAHGRLADWPSA